MAHHDKEFFQYEPRNISKDNCFPCTRCDRSFTSKSVRTNHQKKCLQKKALLTEGNAAVTLKNSKEIDDDTAPSMFTSCQVLLNGNLLKNSCTNTMWIRAIWDAEGWRQIHTSKSFWNSSDDLCVAISNMIKKLFANREALSTLEDFLHVDSYDLMKILVFTLSELESS